MELFWKTFKFMDLILGFLYKEISNVIIVLVHMYIIIWYIFS